VSHGALSFTDEGVTNSANDEPTLAVWRTLAGELTCTSSAALHGALSLTDDGMLTFHEAAAVNAGHAHALATAATINLLFICDISFALCLSPHDGAAGRSQDVCRFTFSEETAC
jgi:hypothetical protein